MCIKHPRNKYADVPESYLSHCKRRRRKALRARILKRHMIDFLKDSSHREMKYIKSTELHSDIPRTTRSVFPSSEKFLNRKRNSLKGVKSVTASLALTVIMYVPSSESRK